MEDTQQIRLSAYEQARAAAREGSITADKIEATAIRIARFVTTGSFDDTIDLTPAPKTW